MIRNSAGGRISVSVGTLSLRDGAGWTALPAAAVATTFHDEEQISLFRKPRNNDIPGLTGILMHPINALLITFPFGALSYLMHWGDVPTFWLNFVCLIPLAKCLGDATEELAAGLKSDVIAGLLNATFGNAVEVVIMINTLRAGLTDVVKATLLGSVLSNLLLVLGMSFFCGGMATAAAKPADHMKEDRQSYREMPSKLAMEGEGAPEADGGDEPTRKSSIDTMMSVMSKEKVQTFSQIVALVNTSMLLLSCLSFSLVTVFYSGTRLNEESMMESSILPISRMCSIIIMSAYGAYIYFQLVTHRESMGGEDDDEEGEAHISVSASIVFMLLTTAMVSFSSKLLVDSLEGVVEESGISQHFIGIILLPIVGNACEHASAIRFAVMDKPGLSIGIAVGSSTQISLFVVPCSVIFGWLMDQPMDLNFGSLNVTVMVVSTVVVLSVVVDGQSNWLQGYLLMASYLIISVLYWYLPNEMNSQVE